MAKTLAAALEKAGLIDPKQAQRQDRKERVALTAEEGRRIKKQQPRLQDKNGVTVIANSDKDLFPTK